MRVDLGSPSPGTIEQAAGVIKSGGVVLYPSDTVYGLGCDPFLAEAVQKLYAIKGRDERKGVLLLVPDLEWVDRLTAEVPAEAEYLIGQFWPGTLTLLFRPSPEVPTSLVGREGRIGIRFPDSPFLQAWMKSLSGPIVSTSANISGSTIPEDLETLRDLFNEKVDLFLEAGNRAGTPPSTVVDLVGEPAIVRSGTRHDEIEAALARFR